MQEQDQKDVHKLQNGRLLGISCRVSFLNFCADKKKIFDNNSNINNGFNIN